MKRWMYATIATTCILSGCGASFSASPEEQRVQQQVSEADLLTMQQAVEAFQQQTGVLPIKTKAHDTPLYIKYPIDFQQLVPTYMAKIPANAYEQGGIYQYVLYDVEQHPTVKLVDLHAAERIRDINLRVFVQQYPAFKQQLAPFVYSLDYEKMGLDELTVKSPYSTTHLPIVVTTQGEPIVDYRIDLQRFIDEGVITATPGDDLLALVADQFDVLPAYSVPYTVDDNERVIFMYDGS